MKKIVIALLVLLMGSNVFAYKKVKGFELFTPPSILPPTVKRIAVVDFQSDWGFTNYFTDTFTGFLLNEKWGITSVSTGLLSNRPGKCYIDGASSKIYEIVERSTLQSIIEEQNLSNSNIADAATASELGKILGVDAIIVGDCDVVSKRDSYRSEGTKKSDGRTYTVYYDCLKHHVEVTVSARVINVADAKVLTTYTKKYEKDDTDCELEKDPQPKSFDELARICVYSHAFAFAGKINPSFVERSLELEKVKTREFKEKADKAAELAEQGDLESAYVIYYSIFEQDSYNPKVLYNLAVLNELVGNYDKALELYNSAFQMDDKKDYLKGVQRIENSKIIKQKLALRDVKLKEHTFNTSPQLVASIQMKKVLLNGDRQDRIQIFKTKSNKEILAKIPGGLCLKLVEQGSNWFKIELPDGKQGFLTKGDVKEIQE